jgi:tetratricopeptide (TPR) repeat protein
LKLAIPIIAVCFLLFYTIDSFALTPIADLSGKWSGTVQMQDSFGYCAYIGSVTAELRQSGNTLSGSYVFTVTSAKPTGRLEGLESCSLEPYSGSVSGTFDGSLVILTGSDGLGFSGSATSDMMTLNFSDSYVIGTAKLQKFADFSQPSSTQPSGQTVDELLQAGLSYLNEKRFDKALEYFNKIIGQDPNNVMGWMGKAVSYVGLKNYDQALTYFKKSLELSPNNKDVLQWLARTYYLKGDCQSASSYSSQALRVDPQNSKFLAEKKVIDACLAKQTAAKKPEPKPEPKPETKPEITTKPAVVKLDSASIKSALDKINDPGARAQKALEILNQLPAGPIPEDLRDLLAHAIHGNAWITAKNKALYVRELENSNDGAVATITPRGDLFNKKPVYFINGIRNSLEESNANAQLLAYLLERPVTRVYNKSDGLISDLYESGKLKIGLLKDNPAVQSLVENIISDLKREEPVEIYAHSEGAIITSVALDIVKEKYPELFAKNAYKISVNTYGGAARNFPEGPAYNHVVFKSDPVPLVGAKDQNVLQMENPKSTATISSIIAGLVVGKMPEEIPGHVWTGYVKGAIPNSIITSHLSDVNPREGIGKDLATRNPELVSQTLKELSFGHDEVAHYYVKNLSDESLKKLPKNILANLKQYLESSSITEYDSTSLTKVNRALGVK